MEVRTYEQFPKIIVLFSSIFSLAVYTLGIFIISRSGIWLVLVYVLYCLWIEFRVLKRSCVNCYYYGKRCGLGKGVLCSWLFKQGKNENFSKANISWLDILPDFMVSIFPLIFGVISIIQNFSWIILLSLLVLIMLSTAGNAVIRGNFLCRYCRQRELGCPAERLFSSAK